MHEFSFCGLYTGSKSNYVDFPVGGWTNPSEKILAKLDHLPKYGWKLKMFETTSQL